MLIGLVSVYVQTKVTVCSPETAKCCNQGGPFQMQSPIPFCLTYNLSAFSALGHCNFLQSSCGLNHLCVLVFFSNDY